jgi:hypothetical protein
MMMPRSPICARAASSPDEASARDPRRAATTFVAVHSSKELVA